MLVSVFERNDVKFFFKMSSYCSMFTKVTSVVSGEAWMLKCAKPVIHITHFMCFLLMFSMEVTKMLVSAELLFLLYSYRDNCLSWIFSLKKLIN